ncbi:TonB-dependent siderophore receptor [Methylorubrum extorquens]
MREDSTTIQGIYFIDKFDTFDDRLHIMGSYRYDWQATNSVTRTPLETNRVSGRNEGESWVAGAAFDVTPWMTVYGNRSVGFVPSVLGTVAGALPAPEGRDLAEVGARYFLFGKRLSLTTSLFDLARTNVTITDPRDPTGQTRILVGGLRSRGTEFELQGEILPGLNVIASLAIQNIAVTDRATEEGGEFFGVPKKTASLWVTYALQSTPFAGLTFGVGARGNSRSRTGNGPDSVYVPGYVVADAMIAYQRDDFSVSLNVKNILNEYSLSPSYFSDYIGINQGRSALLQADYRF